jgi:hypothetical protein
MTPESLRKHTLRPGRSCAKTKIVQARTKRRETDGTDGSAVSDLNCEPLSLASKIKEATNVFSDRDGEEDESADEVLVE